MNKTTEVLKNQGQPSRMGFFVNEGQRVPPIQQIENIGISIIMK